MEEEYKKFREFGKTCFILGYTGQTGTALVQELVNRNIFQKILLFGRRTILYPDEDKYKVLEQRIIDYENLDSHKADFTGCDVGYCCLGATDKRTGKDGFYKVDHDYTVNAAKVARESGCEQFHLVSSNSANPNSMFYYLKVKGQVEEELKPLNFDRYVIYRSAAPASDSEENRPGERAMLTSIKPKKWCSPTALTTPTTTLAKAMVNATVTEMDTQFQVMENKAIFRIAGEL